MSTDQRDGGRAGEALGPTVPRLLVGIQLHRFREAARITPEQAAYEIRASRSKISRMENGLVRFKERDVTDLLTLYGITDEPTRSTLVTLTRQANTPGWWSKYAVVARTSRGFLTRAVRYLAGEAGIRQFLDIGTGLPTANNTHQVAQAVAPESRIVYVDNDPLVLAHARALLTSSPEGSCDYLDADIRNPAAILDTAASLLDFTRPIALMLMGIMGHFTDDEAYPIVSALQAGLPSGSYFALYDGADTNEAFNQAQEGYNASGAVPYYLRSPERFRRFFEGLELVEPGVVPLVQWRPDPGTEQAEIYSYGGMGRKP